MSLKRKGSILCVDNIELPARTEYVNDVIPNNWERYDFPELEENIPEGYKNDPNHNGEWITSIWIVK